MQKIRTKCGGACNRIDFIRAALWLLICVVQTDAVPMTNKGVYILIRIHKKHSNLCPWDSLSVFLYIENAILSFPRMASFYIPIAASHITGHLPYKFPVKVSGYGMPCFSLPAFEKNERICIGTVPQPITIFHRSQNGKSTF